MHSPLEANRTGSLRMVKVIASNRASRRLLSSSPAQTDRLRFCSSTGKTFYSLLSSSFLFFSSLLLPRPALRLYELLLCLLRVPRVFVSSKELWIDLSFLFSFFPSWNSAHFLRLLYCADAARWKATPLPLFFPPLPFFSTLKPLEFSASLHPTVVCVCVCFCVCMTAFSICSWHTSFQSSDYLK